jgi:hypothetical protein
MLLLFSSLDIPKNLDLSEGCLLASPIARWLKLLERFRSVSYMPVRPIS